MPQNLSKRPQEPTCPFASLVRVVEDRSVLLGFLMATIRQPIVF